MAIKDPERRRLVHLAWRRRIADEGRCYRCPSPATEGFKSCESCRVANRIAARNNPKHSQQTISWVKRNLARHRASYNKWQAAQWRKPEYVLIALYRRRLARVLRRHRTDAVARSRVMMGCTPAELKSYLESLFLPGMTWENRGLWHIDHKRPISSFDLTDPEQQKACFHYTNLQPLWAGDNLRKGAKYHGRTTAAA